MKKHERRAEAERRFQAVKAMHDFGMSITAISKQTKVSKGLIYKYVKFNTYEEYFKDEEKRQAAIKAKRKDDKKKTAKEIAEHNQEVQQQIARQLETPTPQVQATLREDIQIGLLKQIDAKLGKLVLLAERELSERREREQKERQERNEKKSSAFWRL